MLKQAAAAGVNVGWVEYADFGLDAYGSGFVTNEDVIARRGDALRKFLKDRQDQADRRLHQRPPAAVAGPTRGGAPPFIACFGC